MSTPTTFWKLAGMSYMQYVSRSTTVLRSALKEPARTKAFANDSFFYNRAVWENGVSGPKKGITEISKAGIS